MKKPLHTPLLSLSLALCASLFTPPPALAAPPDISGAQSVTVNVGGNIVWPPSAALTETFTSSNRAATVPWGTTTLGYQTDDHTFWHSTGTLAGNWSQISTGGTVSWSDIQSKPTTLSGFGITDPVALTSGSYSNPSWITGLAWSKITGTPTTISGYGITDPIALTNGSYSNPSWITGLAWSKISSTPTTLSGYGITDPVALTSGSYSNPSWITGLAWSKISSTPTTLSGYGITNAVANTVTVNGHALSGNVTVSAGDVTTGVLAVANGGTGTATPSLVQGANVTVTGTWPNQTIAASGGGGGGVNALPAWTYSDGGIGTAAAGQFTTDNDTPASVGILELALVDGAGVDQTAFFGNSIKPAQRILITGSNGTSVYAVASYSISSVAEIAVNFISGPSSFSGDYQIQFNPSQPIMTAGTDYQAPLTPNALTASSTGNTSFSSSVNALTQQDVTVTCTGAIAGDTVAWATVNIGALDPGIVFMNAMVTTDTVTLSFYNVDPSNSHNISGYFYVRTFR